MPMIIVPKVLVEKLSEEGAKALVDLFNQAEEKTKEVTLALSEEKYERRLVEVGSGLEQKITQLEAKVEQKIAQLEAKVERRIAEVETKFERRIAEVETKLLEKIANVRADILRWMFIFWIGQFASITTVLILLLKYMK